MAGPVGVAIHGGCGALRREDLTGAEWAAAREALRRSLRAAWDIVGRGGSSLDAVEAAVTVMEDSPAFNAGHGAALNADGFHELDASIMDGATLRAGGVSCVRRIRNPVRAARAILDEGEWVNFAGEGADAWAERAGLAMVPNAYFTTQRRVDALRTLKELEAQHASHRASEGEKHGTVGAVALDRAGHLAAATSTGGFNNKPAARVSDSSVIGAGTYARDGVCAVSCTGRGEFFIRLVAGHEIASRMDYRGQSLKEATDGVIFGDMKRWDVGAGLCAIDANGNAVVPYNTIGMYRGFVTPQGGLHVGVHDDLALVETLVV
ncbi:MAG: beta-aspartyl-peptidase [Rhizobiales bacterium 65-9]|nr:isoaspartyl peptidase/L-asparaginase [Hyphomicrobiales bacterium]OJY36100.1 MAG: beta-aspartyl-peptidase [Rhizobiales bacterium 65-9]